SCSGYDKTKIARVRVSFPGSNVLNAQIEAHTTDAQNALLKYRVAGEKEKPFITPTSERNRDHRFLLTNLKPGQQYIFNIVTSGENSTNVSRDYFFKTIDYPGGIQETFQVTCADTTALPDVFKKGYVMVHQREVPGIIVLLNSKGNIVWHHQSKNAGFRVVHFTTNQTLLCLLGTKEYETSYGSAILELSLAGDTLLYLKKGQNDFQQTIHHEIISNSKNEIVTLCVEDKIIDLRSRGGLENDTVRGDGILVLDRQGRKKWKWTVFDELDPLKDERILQTKRDWMHANSVSFDKDGNYLVSFYNNGQIWKIDAVTGKVLWKFGKGGDFEMPPGVSFEQAHAVHINDRGWLQFFDNGTKNKISGSLAFTLDEKTKKAQLIISTLLPPQLFSNRMGSSYLISDNTLLQCASQQKTVALTNLNGDFLWQLRSSGIISYRALFISKEHLEPFLIS
ncbi:MAG: aryl-sulfate sulfotransferase, partial [Bacteroidota bacterium]|nr:aryl-sulfate sulfotransferase [Bacteroidota bacterium]